ncbi:MAG: hypothetical protein FJX76_25840 [Armatimonadetes bacterium]|nr:hypothetical protein [Armatimonadota bacterium]
MRSLPGMVLAIVFLTASLLHAAPEPDVTLVEAYLANDQGKRQDIFKAGEAGVFVYVFLKNGNPAAAHKHEIKVQAYGPDGKPYGRPLGGSFEVASGEVSPPATFPAPSTAAATTAI